MAPHQVQAHSWRAVTSRRVQVMTRPRSGEDRSRRWLRFDHQNLNDVDFGEPREHPPDSDNRVVATPFEEEFLAPSGGEVAVPSDALHLGPGDLELDAVGVLVEAGTVERPEAIGAAPR